MKKIFLTPFFLLLVLLTNQVFAQKPVKEIPSYVLNQIVNVFMDQAYDTSDTLVKFHSRKFPLLNTKKASYDFHYDREYEYEPFGNIEIPKAILLGDMDGDGVAEMIITPFANFGGSACFGYVFLFKSVNGKWKLLTSFYKIDRYLEKQHIVDGILYGTVLEYDTSDAHCCPSLLTKVWYKYDASKNELVEDGKLLVKKIVD